MQPGIIPKHTTGTIEALALVQKDGAAIFSPVGTTNTDATELGHQIFGDRVMSIPEAARVFEGGEKDRYQVTDHHQPLKPHTDGFAYGDRFPDYIMLTCVRSSEAGGESFLVDGYAVLDQLKADKNTSWVVDALESVSVDQTEEDMQVSQSPIVQYNATGRKLLRRNFSQTPLTTSKEPDRDQAMIDTWINAIDEAGRQVPRFRVEPGQALIVDNYRMLHAREGYMDPNRMFWRVWIWTNECLGVPDMPLHSDSRFASRNQ